nr:hypothetical protein HUO10_003016 [Paraburkholderia busanensis]
MHCVRKVVTGAPHRRVGLIACAWFQSTPIEYESLLERDFVRIAPLDLQIASIRSTRPTLGGNRNGRQMDVSDCAVCEQSLTRGPHVLFSDPQEICNARFTAQKKIVSVVRNGFFTINGVDRLLSLSFYLWLRENYIWAQSQINSRYGREKHRPTAAITNELLTIYEQIKRSSLWGLIYETRVKEQRFCYVPD